MIHACVRRFVVMGTVGIFWELNMASDSMFQEGSQRSSGVMLWGALGGLGQGRKVAVCFPWRVMG